MAPSYLEGIAHTIYISTDIAKVCEHCAEYLRSENFAASVNHYIEEHGYKLLHVGSETDNDHEGKPFHKTVAVLGK